MSAMDAIGDAIAVAVAKAYLPITPAPGLAAEDIGRLRNVYVWARANGWTNDGGEWTDPTGSVHVIGCLEYDDPDRTTGSLAIYRAGVRFEVPYVESVAEAMDVLVAYRILPGEFSRAYRAGYGQGRDDEYDGESFPAWMWEQIRAELKAAREQRVS
jgi:hypothetical protein